MKRSPLRTLVFILLLSAVAGGMADHAWADDNETEAYGIAIKGYDPVAYFTMGEAVLGTSTFHFLWNEAIWHFSSSRHRDLFSADPIKYAPRHSGF